MSTDTVDDLHYAEDTAGTLAEALRSLMGAEGGEPDDNDGESVEAWARAATALAAWDGFCRPSCEENRAWAEDLDDDDEDPCEAECCGCPCHDREPVTEHAAETTNQEETTP